MSEFTIHDLRWRRNGFRSGAWKGPEKRRKRVGKRRISAVVSAGVSAKPEAAARFMQLSCVFSLGWNDSFSREQKPKGLIREWSE
jgi:hypothetical protein